MGTWVLPLAGLVNCPFIEVPVKAMEDAMEGKMISDKMEDKMMTDVPPPKTQMKNGITPQDVKCKQGLERILKTSDGSAVFVRPDTAQLLVLCG